MRITVEWQTEAVTTYRAEVEVPAEVLAGGVGTVSEWVRDGNNATLVAREESAEPVSSSFTRETVDWQGVEGTYGDDMRIPVRLPVPLFPGEARYGHIWQEGN